jgi:hypothetical protein
VKPTDNVNSIKFHLFHQERVASQDLTVVPIIDTLPTWYRESKRFLDNLEGTPTFKACIALFDSMSFGYCFTLPTDITIKDVDGSPVIEVAPEYNYVFTKRTAMDNFPTPVGCYDEHYAFLPDWGVQLPEGYSGLYTQPLNRFDLPFVSTSGVIENDVYFSPGQIPFFIRKDSLGVIPKGTPITQVIPFKRDEWKSDINILNPHQFHLIDTIDKQELRSKKSGGYRDKYWIGKVTK